jgi:hypothetical protein
VHQCTFETLLIICLVGSSEQAHFCAPYQLSTLPAAAMTHVWPMVAFAFTAEK